MSDKQLSPIVKAIAWCDKEIKKQEQLKSRTYLPNKFIPITAIIASLEKTKKKLQGLLEEEKKFAEDAFKEGVRRPQGIIQYFEDYYKKYES